MRLLRIGRMLILGFTLSVAGLCAPIGGAVTEKAFAQKATATGASGRPLPRFVSLKSSEVNLRKGPGTDYPTAWVFRRAGLPVEIIEEHQGWRKVRDAEGTTGWVLRWLLSGRRTAQVLPWEVKAGQERPRIAIRSNDSESARALALVEAGVIANILKCDQRWCKVTIGTYKGYVEQKKLWGVYDGETIE